MPLDTCTVLHDDLKEFHGGFFSFYLTTVATQLLVSGWFLTSKEAQNFMREKRKLALFVSAIIVVAFSLECLEAVQFQEKIGRIMELTRANACLPGPEYYDFRNLSGWEVWPLMTGKGLLHACMIWIVNRIAKEKAPVKTAEA